MHIADGVLSLPVLATGALLALGGVTIGLKKLEEEQIPKAALLSSAFFVASAIHLPLGPASVHLVLNGLIGLILGWVAFPIILIALFLQAVLFGFGGFSVLGVNTLNLALPAVLCFYLLSPFVLRGNQRTAFLYGWFAGALAIGLSTVMLGLSLLATGREFIHVVQLSLIAHLPVMFLEGFMTGSIVVFLRQVRPQLLVSWSTTCLNVQ